MYVTAQRPAADEPYVWPGINAYLYLHQMTWSGNPPPNLSAASFEACHEIVPSRPGRRIRSYLDIVAPDDCARDELRRAVEHLHGIVTSGASARPWSHVFGRCQVTFMIEPALDAAWHAELHLLWDEAQRLRFDPDYRTAPPPG